MSKTIIFIHGLHENAHSWDAWKLFFENAGYNCYAPAYPYHEGIPAELRQHPDKRLAHIRLRDVVAHYSQFIDKLNNEAPILMGHSMGGLIVQLLIQQGKGAAGICITSASPRGVLTLKWSFIKSNIGVINPLKGNSLFCGTREWFHYAICNTMSREESDALYENTVVPESRNIPRSSRFSDGKIDFKKPHKPLLFVSAEKDHIIPISLTIKNAEAYKDRQSITDFKEFKGRAHCIGVETGWEEVAQFIAAWMTKI